MLLEKLSNDPKVAIGLKQVKKALLADKASLVYIAEDAEEHVKSPIVELANEKHVEVVFVQTMVELGKACNIDVGAATAVIEK